MEDLLVMLAVLLLLAACCGLPILLLRPVRLINGNKNRQGELLGAAGEDVRDKRFLDRPTLDRR